MHKIGDKVTLGNMEGEIVNVRSKTWIGFHPHNETYYDILLKNISEEVITQEKNGTD